MSYHSKLNTNESLKTCAKFSNFTDQCLFSVLDITIKKGLYTKEDINI